MVLFGENQREAEKQSLFLEWFSIKPGRRILLNISLFTSQMRKEIELSGIFK